MSKKDKDNISIAPNHEQSKLLLSALDALPDNQKGNVNYQRLYKQLQLISTVWERRIKNKRIVEAKIEDRGNR